MSKNATLVDPLAALFRPQLTGIAPLLLDATEVEVKLLPPLARVTITRRFTNASDQLLEAVLTLPPAALHEVIYGLTVSIGGTDYHALAQNRERAQHAHGVAIDAGRRAILYELVGDGAQLISVAGIEARAQVAVRIESVRPLDRLGNTMATLSIALSADPRQFNLRLPDSEALLTTPARHHATLKVLADGLTVGLLDPNRTIASGENMPIDCVRPVSLRVAPFGDRSLDHSAFHVEAPGGWEVSSGVRTETFFHPLNPDGRAINDRTDWIFGLRGIRDGQVRVTAPSPLPDAGRLRPDAHAVAAFAAANFMEAGVPCELDALRLAANILTRRTSLVFVGPEGELPDETPTLRKLALPTDIVPISVPPPPARPMPEPDAGPLLPPYPGPPIITGADAVRLKPSAREPRYHWLTWSAIGLSALCVIGAIQLVRIPLQSVFIAWVVLMLLNALRFFPREGSPVRRRLPLLLLLALPWVASIVCGPLGFAGSHADAARQSLLILFQEGLLVSGVVLPLILLLFMRGARPFTLTVGLLNLLITFLATSASTIGPGS